MRSPSAAKYSMSVSGNTLASASTMQSPCRHCRNSRKRRSISYCSTGFATLLPPLSVHEARGTQQEPRDAELNPEAHELEDFRLHLGVGCIEVRLEVVEAMEVPGLGLRVIAP